MDKKPTLIAYTHAPATSPGVQGLHIMLFRLLEALEQEHDIYVLCRNEGCYDFYMKRFAAQHPNMKILPVPDNMDGQRYQLGLVEMMIDEKVGHIDKALWFWPGMSIVTPEARLKEVYDGLVDKSLAGKSISINDAVDGSVVQEAEMLYVVIKHNPKFIYRVGDYTEPHIERIINYPMKLLSYYPNEQLGHQKIHDSELLHFIDPIEDAPKTYDFIFGYTVEIPERAYLSDFCFSHIKQNDKFKLYVKDKHFSKYSPINTQLPSDEYFDKLRYAKFSLIAPSTDPTEVSVNRVYEDIARKCVPIFMKDVQYWKAFDDEVNELIRDNLVYDEDKFPFLNDFIATLDYEKLVNRFLDCKMIKQFHDKDWLYRKISEECS